MARQRGIVKLEGTMGDITFQKTRDGYMAKEKTSIPASKIASDPAFARTRENMAEFARAGRAGKLLRTALRAQLQRVADSRMISRLTREMMRVVQADATSERGRRNVLDGETALLEGFEFNVNGKLGTTLFAPYTATIDRVSGEAKASLPAFVPADLIAAPAGATHFRIFSAASEVDFENGKFQTVLSETGILPWDSSPTAVIDLVNALPPASTKVLFLAIGIEFMQEVNGSQYPLKNGAFNAMALVKVEGV